MRAPRCGRGSLSSLPVLAILMLVLGPVGGLNAQDARTQSAFAVKGVAASDALNVRDAPDGNQIVGRIPADGRAVMALGPRVKVKGGGTWMQVRYGTVIGWVNKRFLAPDTVQTASADRRAATTSAVTGEAAVRGRLFEGVWGHERWTLTIDAEQLAFLPAQDAARPARILALGSRECGVVYERNFAAMDIDDVPATFTDPRIQTWTRASTRDRAVAVMVITCGSLSHRFFVFLTDMHRMLVAEWDEKGWLMHEEFSSGSRQVGGQ